MKKSERRRLYHLKNKEDENDYSRWRSRYSFDYAELLRRGKSCVCCGNSPVTFDHIVSVQRRKNLSRRVREQLTAFEAGNIQFLCPPCNNSKFDKEICELHGKYLGVWNYLPNLDDIEAE